jgi:molecular chaperone GrpE
MEENVKCESHDCKCHDTEEMSAVNDHTCCKENVDNSNYYDPNKPPKNKKDKKREELTKLHDKVKELEEKNLRDKAELINYRRRKDEELARMLKYSNEDLVKEILPMLDNFERAIDMDDDNLDDEVSKFLSGFKMIYANLKSVLEKYEIRAIDGKNKPFDPTYHQAVMTDKVDDVESGMVIEVLQKGYILKDKVIRPAMVRVSE